jgi:adenylate cyclase
MEELKEIETGGYLPVLVLTAQPEHKLRALQAGAKDFLSKPFDLAEVLTRVFNMLEVRLLHLEAKRLHAQVLAEQKMAERLLFNVLPRAIAQNLPGRIEITADSCPKVVAESFPEVTVLFADIVDFSKFCDGRGAEELVGVLNDIFGRFDRCAEARGLERIKTSGASYMAAAGLPVPAPDHPVRAANLAIDLMEVMEQFNHRSPYKLPIRIGLNSGEVVAGVVGSRKFVYDLWGEVVHTASWMESSGQPGRIQVTDATREQLGAPFVFEERGLVECAGRSPVHTWFLNSRKG